MFNTVLLSNMPLLPWCAIYWLLDALESDCYYINETWNVLSIMCNHDCQLCMSSKLLAMRDHDKVRNVNTRSCTKYSSRLQP